MIAHALRSAAMLGGQALQISRIVFSLLATVAVSPSGETAFGFELEAGFAAVEEGDDRMRPGAAMHVAWNEAYQGRLYYYGSELGPVRQETFLISGARRFSVFSGGNTAVAMGLALMNQRIVIDYDESSVSSGISSEDERREDNYNGGLTFGLSWAMPKASRPLSFRVSWDSHLFPAGLNGMLFLSTGRKQTISVTGGFAF